MNSMGEPPPSAASANSYLVLLTLINAFNYIDRYVPSACKQLIQNDLQLDDTQSSLPLTAFILVYMFTSPLFGIAADSHFLTRPKLISLGVFLWCLSTAAASLSPNFFFLLLTRSLVGIGEAAYASISPSIIADLYPPSLRGRALSIFYSAIPIGAALGFSLGGAIGAAIGWRNAFLICGLPGLILAGLCWRMKDPNRGQFDEEERSRQEEQGEENEHSLIPSSSSSSFSSTRWYSFLPTLLSNPFYCYLVLGTTLNTFGAGGIADWLPVYLVRERNMDLTTASGIAGAALVVGGLGGTATGWIVGEKVRTWRGRRRGNGEIYSISNPHLFVSGVSLLITSFSSLLVLYIDFSLPFLFLFLLFTQLTMWMNTGLTNGLTANCLPSSLRSRGFALSIFLTHALGDAISPAIIGAISDGTGDLRNGMALAPVAFGAGAIVWMVGWWRLPRLKEKEEMREEKEREEEEEGRLGVEMEEEIEQLNEEVKSTMNQLKNESRNKRVDGSNDSSSGVSACSRPILSL